MPRFEVNCKEIIVPPLTAYHSDKAIKTKYVNRVKAHAKADEIIKGKYWEEGKGCAVGCTIHSDNHAKYEKELGIPEILARLEDRIFEELADDKAKAWPLKFLSAIKVGADLSDIWNEFAIWLLIDKDYGVINKANTQRTKDVINKVAELYKARCVDINEWRKARAAAADAAYAAAADAAYAAAADAAYAVADAAAAAAADDAAAAAYAAAHAVADAAVADAAAARKNHYYEQSRKLLELLKAAPVKK